MKQRRWILAALLLVTALFLTGCKRIDKRITITEKLGATSSPMPAPTAEPLPTLDQPLIVLYTNDVHCGFQSGIGIRAVAAARQALLSGDHYVVMVDAGDFNQGESIGTLSDGESPIDIMNSLGYDLAVPGNHDFHFGAEAFLHNIEHAEFPYIACNLFWKKSGERVLDAYKMMNFNGVRVAFVGILTPTTESTLSASILKDQNGEPTFDFGRDESGERLYGIVQEAVDNAKADGAQYVIALAHCGNAEAATPWTSSEIIAHTTGIDVMIDGHSHTVMESENVKNRDGKNVILTQTGTKLQHFGMLTVDPLGGIAAKLIDDNGVGQKLDDIQAEYDAKLKEKIAETEFDLVINDPKQIGVRIVRNAETNMADLLADAYRIVAETDIGVINGGNVRDSIKAGDITYDDVLRVNPFGNQISVVEATGQQILNLLEFGAEHVPKESGAFIQVSGLTYEIHTYIESSVVRDENGYGTGVAGEYRVKNVLVGGEPLDPAKTYTVAGAHCLLMEALDGNTALSGATLLREAFMQDDMLIKQYFEDVLGGIVPDEYKDPYGQGRIIAVEKRPKK